MTIAEINTNEKINILVHGHSGYAENGHDIICAGISSLTQAFAMVADNVTCETSEGFMQIIADATKDNRVRLEMLISGLKAISESYPQYFEIFFKI